MKRFPLLPVVLVAVILPACGGDAADAPRTAGTDASPHLLVADVPGTVSVLEAKTKADGEVVAVVGRVRSRGKGIFTLVDDSLDYCGRGEDPMEGCPTPWDYCCLDQDAVQKATIVVKAQARDGTPVAKEELGVLPTDLVAVRGTLVKQPDGSLALVATEGWFRRHRPVWGDWVDWTGA